MNMGKRIAKRLEDLGWERKQLLSRVPDLSPQSLSNLIRRDSKRSEWDEKIAAALGVSVQWLTHGHEEHIAAEPAALYDASGVTMRHVIALQNSIHAMATSLGVDPQDLTDNSPEARNRLALALDGQSPAPSTGFSVPHMDLDATTSIKVKKVTSQKK